VRLIQTQQSQPLPVELPGNEIDDTKAKGVVVQGLGNVPSARPVTHRAAPAGIAPWKGRVCECRRGTPLAG